MKAVVLPDTALLTHLAALSKRDAALDVLVNMHPLRDTNYAARLGLATAALTHDVTALKTGYARAGWIIRGIEDVTGTPVHATRWGRQLHHARREVWRLRAVRSFAGS